MKEKLKLDGAFTITPQKFGDNRGYFSEVFKKEWFDIEWVQENQSLSTGKNTIRGMHLQSGKFSQTKLIRVLKGAILDVIVDLRRGSPTFGEHIAVELTQENFKQLFIPKHFAHGFLTLTDEVIVEYKVDSFYNKDSEVTLNYNDSDLNISWPINKSPVLSEKDKNGVSLKQFISDFK